LPRALKNKIVAARPVGFRPDPTRHARKVLLMTGCVQPTMMPTVDAATIRVFDALGYSTVTARGAGCCGAINFHLDAQKDALIQMRANIDAWLPLLDSGEVEAIVVNASGCGAMLKDYPRHLQHDPDYVAKAFRLASRVRDVAEIVAPQAAQLKVRLSGLPESVAFHPPCTLQHWQGLSSLTEKMLRDLGFQLLPFSDAHLCCGSAGTYSLTQPDLSLSLRDRKVQSIQAVGAGGVVSSNVGCIAHLQSGTELPVRHWIEVVDEALGTQTGV
jgi:glycolate oxidase iron-sulfur subunit